MELYSEYLLRKNIKGCVQYADKSTIVLQNGNEIINISIAKSTDKDSPWGFFQLTVIPNPVMYASADMMNFSLAPSGDVIERHKMEWNEVESKVSQIVEKYKKNYSPIDSHRATMICWTNFLKCYDMWVAHFVPLKILEEIAATFDGKGDSDKAIKSFEAWLSGRFERIYGCWKNLKSSFDSQNYAQWLVEMFNGN